MKAIYVFRFFLIITLPLYLTACFDFNIFGGDDDIDTSPTTFLTEIIRVEIEPNPVIAGDSVAFTCIIKDSLDSSIYFNWHIMPKDTLWTRTEENTYKIKAPDNKGSYDGIVEALKDGPPYYGVPSKVFIYEVIEK